MAQIITNLGLIVVWVFGLFEDLMVAITTNDYILFPVTFGFMILGVSFAVGLIRRIVNIFN